jgi:hypothetical protein
LAITGVVAAYSIVAAIAIVSELNWRARRWMAPVAPLNTMMAASWIVVLTALATPIANPWAISAQSQYQRLADGRVSAEEFDYGYLRFSLGRYGEDALDRLLALENHPQAGAIRDGAARARAAENYREYRNPESSGRRPNPAPEPAAPTDDTAPDDPDAEDLLPE